MSVYVPSQPTPLCSPISTLRCNPAFALDHSHRHALELVNNIPSVSASIQHGIASLKKSDRVSKRFRFRVAPVKEDRTVEIQVLGVTAGRVVRPAKGFGGSLERSPVGNRCH